MPGEGKREGVGEREGETDRETDRETDKRQTGVKENEAVVRVEVVVREASLKTVQVHSLALTSELRVRLFDITEPHHQLLTGHVLLVHQTVPRGDTARGSQLVVRTSLLSFRLPHPPHPPPPHPARV